MNHIIALYQVIPSAWIAALGGGAFIALAVQLIKKIFGVKSTLVIHILTVSTSFLVSTLPVFIQSHPISSAVLGAYTTAFYTAANVLYAISKASAPFWQKVSAYNAHKQEVKNGTAPELQPAPTSAEYDG